ncbi:sulfotransferase family protein [Mycobacterium marinum]|uniref:sulfotransferase family protein n=1 Tax=Mycobacterium marinum TaxID=1781 RepID=UPI00356201F7
MNGPAADTGTAARPVALFVLGMPRSGTSALTRALSLCGGSLPAKLVGARVGNPLGHWEPRAANYLNDAILYRHGSSAFDPSLRLQEENALNAKENAACVDEIRGFLTTLPAAPLVLIKDPRITVLSGVWFEAVRQVGFDAVAVIAVRHPQDVIASVAALNRTSPELSSALWLKYNLLAERDTRGMPRVFVQYANLLEDWRREVKRISVTLGIDLSTRDEGAIDGFLTPDLRHQRHSGPVTDRFGTDWVSSLYEALCAAARDEVLDGPLLDRIFEAYRASEHDFRTAFEDFRHNHNGVLFRPSITKLINEVVATTHLHRVLARPSVARLAREIRRL